MTRKEYTLASPGGTRCLNTISDKCHVFAAVSMRTRQAHAQPGRVFDCWFIGKKVQHHEEGLWEANRQWRGLEMGR